MNSPLVVLLAQARRVGVTLDRDGDSLRIRGPRTAGELLRSLAARKADLLTFGLVDFYVGRGGLDWRTATVTEHPGRCILCGGWALLREPYDGKPCHKVCAEAALRLASPGTPTTETRRAA